MLIIGLTEIYRLYKKYDFLTTELEKKTHEILHMTGKRIHDSHEDIENKIDNMFDVAGRDMDKTYEDILHNMDDMRKLIDDIQNRADDKLSAACQDIENKISDMQESIDDIHIELQYINYYNSKDETDDPWDDDDEDEEYDDDTFLGYMPTADTDNSNDICDVQHANKTDNAKSIFVDFLDSECTVGEDGVYIATNDLYDEYKKYTNAKNLKCVCYSTFLKYLKSQFRVTCIKPYRCKVCVTCDISNKNCRKYNVKDN